MTLTINGVERQLPVSDEESVQELIRQLERTVVTDTNWIASIKVNGTELTLEEAENGEGIAASPVSAIGSVEVLTAHPREIAEDTLQNLLLFCDHLATISRDTADLVSGSRGRSAPAQTAFNRLIDGISTFFEGLQGAKRILRVNAFPCIDILEADLTSLLKDLHDYFNSGDVPYVAELLRTHLPANLQQWKQTGLPALIRSRDS